MDAYLADSDIVALYFLRDEAAIRATADKYGSYCHGIAKNILSSDEDAEECVNDTYNRAWNAIPPQRPVKLRPWLGKIVRNIALNLYNKNHTQKRYAGMTEVLHELSECLPSKETVEDALEEKALAARIDGWLRGLAAEDRVLFVRRYFHGVPLSALAKERNISPGKLTQRMYRLRQSLKDDLERS